MTHRTHDSLQLPMKPHSIPFAVGLFVLSFCLPMSALAQTCEPTNVGAYQVIDPIDDPALIVLEPDHPIETLYYPTVFPVLGGIRMMAQGGNGFAGIDLADDEQWFCGMYQPGIDSIFGMNKIDGQAWQLPPSKSCDFFRSDYARCGYTTQRTEKKSRNGRDVALAPYGPIGVPSVVRVPNGVDASNQPRYRYFMAYNGGNSDYIPGRIYWASSDDGDHWTHEKISPTDPNRPALADGPLVYAKYWNCEWIGTQPFITRLYPLPNPDNRAHGFEKGVGEIVLLYDQSDDAGGQNAHGTFYVYFSYSHTLPNDDTRRNTLAFRFDYDPTPNGNGVGLHREIYKNGAWTPHSGDLAWNYDFTYYHEPGLTENETIDYISLAGDLKVGFTDIQRNAQTNRWVAIGVLGGETEVEGQSLVFTQESVSLSNPQWSAPSVVDLGSLMTRFGSDYYKCDGRKYFLQYGPGLYFGDIDGVSGPWMFTPVRKSGVSPTIGAFAGLGIIRTRLRNCDYDLCPKLAVGNRPGIQLGSAADHGSFTVTSSPGCEWEPMSRSDFITIDSFTNTTVNFSAAANDTIARSGYITVAGRTFEVKQEAGCIPRLLRMSETVPACGDEVVAHIDAPPACRWTTSWKSCEISVPPDTPAGGTGPGHVTFRIAPNPSETSERQFAVTIGHESFTIHQPPRAPIADFNVYAGDCTHSDHPVYMHPTGQVVSIIPIVRDRTTGQRLNTTDFQFSWSRVNEDGTRTSLGNTAQLDRTVPGVPELIEVLVTRGGQCDVMLVDIRPGSRQCRHRLIRLDGETLPSKQVPAGHSVSLSPDEVIPGESYEWHRQRTGEPEEVFSTSAEVSDMPTVDTTYYFVATTSSNADVSDDATVRVNCGATVLDGPRDSSAILVDGSATVSTSVVATGKGPFTYTWYVNGTISPQTTGSTYRWTSPPAEPQHVYVDVTDACGTVTHSRTATLSVFACEPATIAAITPGGPIFDPEQPVELSVVMNPPESTENDYDYEWYRGDSPIAYTNSPHIVATTYSTDSFYVRITRHSCGAVTTSEKIYLSVFGQCDLPPLITGQSALWIRTDSPTGVTFRASIDFPANIQWYSGQTGDTRYPVPSDIGNPHELTVGGPGDLARPYWVRASLDCGTHRDSETLTFSKGPCNPILITGQPQPIDIAYNGNATLSVQITSTSGRTFTWYEGLDENHPLPQTGRTIVIPNVIRSGIYWVKIIDLNCGTDANSFPTTVRVSSHTGITVSQWPTDIWVDKDDELGTDLIVAASGASGYQWFAGDVGDESHLIGGATAPAYRVRSLTADAKYWVRAFGNGGLVDSLTIHVSVCDPPHFNQAVQTSTYVVPGQWIWLGVDAGGTALSYQWYIGTAGQLTQPTGRNINLLQVHPSETTDYWVRLTAACGPGGNSPRTLDSPTITVGVCPTINGAPTAAKTVVMPGSATTLSINVQGTRLTVQWYIGPTTDRTHPIPNSNSSSITTPPITADTQFWVEVTSGGCARHSTAILIETCKEPRIAWTVGSRNIASGQAEWLYTSVTSSTGALVTYYKGHAGDVAGSTIVAGPTPSTAIQVTPTATTTYWARATSGDCSGDSGEITLTVCIPTFTQPPANRNITLGQSVTFTTATDVAATFQWFAGTSGDTSHPVTSGTTTSNTSSITVSPTTDTQYWVRAIGCSIEVDSAAATVTVCQPPAITQQTPSVWITRGNSIQLNVSATGSGLAYQWYQGNAGVTSSPIPNAVEAFTSVTPLNTTPYWARITGGCGAADTTTITISVCVPPVITVPPASQSTFSGTSATLTVTATEATTTPLTYQWYSGTAPGGTVISGATSSTYVTPPLTSSANYWVKAIAGQCTTNSATATVSMCAYPEVLTGPANKQTAVGELVRLDIGAMSPIPDQIRWLRGASGDTVNPITGWQGVTYVDVAPTVTTQYWAQVRKGTCTSRTTTTTVTVCVPTFTQQPPNRNITAGQSTSLTVTTDVPVSFQWYTGAPGVTTSPVPGGTTATITVSPTADTQYWVRATGCGISVDSTTAIVTVCQPPAITSQSPNAWITQGSSLNLVVNATGTGPTYQWYLGTSGVTTSLIPGATNALTTVNPQNTTSYWARVSNSCGTRDTPTITISVCATPVITVPPQSRSIGPGSTTTLSVTATQATTTPLTYQWYSGTSPNGSAISGATSASYTTPPLTAPASYWVKVTAGACFLNSQTATITMCTFPEVITPLPQNWYSAYGDLVTLTLNNMSPLGKTVSWFQGVSGVRTNPLTSPAVDRTVNVAPGSTTQYWAEFTYNGCTSRTSTITVYVCIPKITEQPTEQWTWFGNQATFTLNTAPLPGQTIQWYEGQSGDTASPVPGATGMTLTVTGYYGTYYWARITGPAPCNTAVDSNAAMLGIY